MASVNSRPPVPSTRTKRGTPPSCTAIAVTPPPNDTMPSAPAIPSASAAPGSPAAPAPTSARSGTARASGRMSASGTRSTAATLRPPASTAATRRLTVASWTAASKTCMRGSPPSPGLAGPRIAKSSTASSSGIGMSSAAWNCSALPSSSRDMSGISIWRTTTRGLARPRRTEPLLRPTSARRRPTASVTAASSATSPSRIVSRPSATWPNISRRGGSPGRTSATVTALVPMSRPIRRRAMRRLLECSAPRGTPRGRAYGHGNACQLGSRPVIRNESGGTRSSSTPSWRRRLLVP